MPGPINPPHWLNNINVNLQEEIKNVNKDNSNSIDWLWILGITFIMVCSIAIALYTYHNRKNIKPDNKLVLDSHHQSIQLTNQTPLDKNLK